MALQPGEVCEVFMNLIKVSDPGYFSTQHSYLQSYNYYQYKEAQTLLSGGLYVILKVGEFNLLLDTHGSTGFSEYVTWLLAILSGIFYLSYMLDLLCRSSAGYQPLPRE